MRKLETPIVTPIVCDNCGKTFEHRQEFVEDLPAAESISRPGMRCSLCGIGKLVVVEPWTKNDPHGANVEWRAAKLSGDGAGHIEWRGEWARNCYQRTWTGDVHQFIIDRKRVELWAKLLGVGS